MTDLHPKFVQCKSLLESLINESREEMPPPSTVPNELKRLTCAVTENRGNPTVSAQRCAHTVQFLILSPQFRLCPVCTYHGPATRRWPPEVNFLRIGDVHQSKTKRVLEIVFSRGFSDLDEFRHLAVRTRY